MKANIQQTTSNIQHEDLDTAAVALMAKCLKVLFERAEVEQKAAKETKTKDVTRISRIGTKAKSAGDWRKDFPGIVVSKKGANGRLYWSSTAGWVKALKSAKVYETRALAANKANTLRDGAMTMSYAAETRREAIRR